MEREVLGLGFREGYTSGQRPRRDGLRGPHGGV